MSDAESESGFDGQPSNAEHQRYSAVATELVETFSTDVIFVYGDDQHQTTSAPSTALHNADDNTMLSIDSGGFLPEASAHSGGGKVRHTSIQKAAFHIFKSNVGVGIFLLPMVYRDAGYLMSPIFTAMLGAIVIDATIMLLDAKERINDPKVVTYSDMVHFVLGRRARIVANVSIVLVQFGFCLLYLQTAAMILSSMVSGSKAVYATFVFIEVIALLPFTFLSNELNLLAFASAIATFTVLFATVTTLCYSMSQLFFHSASVSVSAAGQVQRWPMFLASHLSALEGVCVVLPVDESVRKDRRPRFRATMVQTLVFVVTLYVGYSSIGYLAYGDGLTSSIVTVIGDSGFVNVVKVSLAVNLLLTFPIQYCPGIQICDKALGIPLGSAFNWRDTRAVALRTGLQLVFALVALVVGPHALGFVLSLIGSVAATSAALIFPALLELCTAAEVRRRDVAGTAAAEVLAAPQLQGGSERLWKAVLDLLTSLHADGSRHWPLKKLRAVGYLVFAVFIMVVGTVTCFTQPSNG